MRAVNVNYCFVALVIWNTQFAKYRSQGHGSHVGPLEAVNTSIFLSRRIRSIGKEQNDTYSTVSLNEENKLPTSSDSALFLVVDTSTFIYERDITDDEKSLLSTYGGFTTEPTAVLNVNSQPTSEPLEEYASRRQDVTVSGHNVEPTDPSPEPEPLPQGESHSEPQGEPEPRQETESRQDSEPLGESEPHQEPDAQPEQVPENEPEPESQEDSTFEIDLIAGVGSVEPERNMNVTSEPSAEPGGSTKRTAIVIILSVLLMLILITNVTIMVTILKTKTLKRPGNMFILSLNFADICIALFVVPGMISGRFSELWMANTICQICHYFSHLSMAAASFSLVGISLDRLKAIARPLRPKLNFQETGMVMAFIWVFAALYGLRAPFLFSITPVDVRDDEGTIYILMVCWVSRRHADTNSPLIIFDFIVVFALPALTIIVSYSGLLFFLSKNTMKTQFTKPDNRKNSKALRLSILMISIFIICHLPVYSMRVYLDRGSPVITESQDMITAFDIISILNSVLNPVVYGFLNKQIRDAFLDVVFKSKETKVKAAHNKVHPMPTVG